VSAMKVNYLCADRHLTVLTGAGNRSLNKGEMLVKGLIEMVTTVIGAEIGDEAVYVMVEALLPHVPTLQVRNEKQTVLLKFKGNGPFK
jgi:hypothetical protein